ncbi:MAG: ATP-dependent DNA helicase RecG [Candidatus Omnitrophica bacterium]|nr:ATP-dependent DNA helicase RecG [Candidatus Omnitrophota bacterium]
MKTQTPPQTGNVRYLKGVGPKRAFALEKLGIHSVHDLIYFFPRRYEDRSHFKSISEVRPGESATVRGKVLAVKLKPVRRMPIVEVLIGDANGIIPAVWFNQPYLRSHFTAGRDVIVFGKVDLYQGRMQMISPEYEFVDPDEEGIHAGRITPIYPLTEGLFQRSLRSTLKDAVESQLEKIIPRDFLSEAFRQKHQLMELRDAVREMHFPVSFERLEAARQRIIFDEFFLFEITLLKKVENMKTKYCSYALQDIHPWIEEFFQSLPFQLTAGQLQAISEITGDLKKSYPMNRLLMGDVGSGKTVVAALALLLTAKNKYQSAFLVPTEILAEQHYQTLEKLLKPFSVSLGLLTSSTPPQRRERMLAELAQGTLSILIGTHAILRENVRFSCLALVIIDEQHKFGVHQRCQLLNTNPRPHQLVMTATPIPRTLALTLYADLDISVLRELPTGRQPVKTYWITRDKQNQILQHILEKVQQGEQAYFIFPLIEETEKMDLLAAKREFEHLKKKTFAKVSMGLVHGRLSQDERDYVMRSFRKGDISVLVATSVVEVGVDNPNATVMVIENAERFGLSQLHQMRGRIGRGSRPSECFLFGEPKTEEGKRRMRILTKSNDGFLIAEEDLKLRGPGDFWGTRQSGDPMFRIADPIRDYSIFSKAREIAIDLVKRHAINQSEEWNGIKNHLEQFPLHY